MKLRFTGRDTSRGVVDKGQQEKTGKKISHLPSCSALLLRLLCFIYTHLVPPTHPPLPLVPQQVKVIQLVVILHNSTLDLTPIHPRQEVLVATGDEESRVRHHCGWVGGWVGGWAEKIEENEAV